MIDSIVEPEMTTRVKIA